MITMIFNDRIENHRFICSFVIVIRVGNKGQ